MTGIFVFVLFVVANFSTGFTQTVEVALQSMEPYGDLGRTQRQNLFVDSLMEKLKAEPENIVVLLDAAKAVLVTDLDNDTLSSLVCLADSVEKESVAYINY